MDYLSLPAIGGGLLWGIRLECVRQTAVGAYRTSMSKGTKGRKEGRRVLTGAPPERLLKTIGEARVGEVDTAAEVRAMDAKSMAKVKVSECHAGIYGGDILGPLSAFWRNLRADSSSSSEVEDALAVLPKLAAVGK